MTTNDIRNEDLGWYWNSAEGDMGLRAAPLEPSYGGSSHDGNTRRQSKAVERYNRITLVLGSLEERDVKMLRLAHTDVPPALRPRFAKLGTLALVVVEEAPSPEWVLDPSNDAALVKLTAKCRQRVAKAIRTFEKELRKWEGYERRSRKL